MKVTSHQSGQRQPADKDDQKRNRAEHVFEQSRLRAGNNGLQVFDHGILTIKVNDLLPLCSHIDFSL